jgi:uncharacterized protein DUF3309
MVLRILVLILLTLLVIAVAPVWRYSRTWGFGPSAAVAFLLLIVLFLVMRGEF